MLSTVVMKLPLKLSTVVMQIACSSDAISVRFTYTSHVICKKSLAAGAFQQKVVDLFLIGQFVTNVICMDH